MRAASKVACLSFSSAFFLSTSFRRCLSYSNATSKMPIWVLKMRHGSVLCVHVVNNM